MPKRKKNLDSQSKPLFFWGYIALWMILFPQTEKKGKIIKVSV